MEIFIILGLILLNGLFSMAEIALVSARKARLEADVKKGSSGAKAALNLANEPDKFLSTVQIGITLIGILTGLYSGKAFNADFAAVIAKVGFLAQYAQAISTTLIVVVVTYLTIVFGELVPKRLGLSLSERVARHVAQPMLLLSKIMTPIVSLLSASTSLVIKALGIKDSEDKVTEEEIKSLVKEGLDSGEVQEVEHEIVGRVFNLGDRDIDSIMTHRNDFVWLDMGDDKPAIREKVMNDIHDVYPVKSGSTDELSGVVYLKDLFGQIDCGEFSLESIVHPALYLPDNKSVYGALEYFRENGVKYSFVTDEFGDVKGIVTLTDIMEAVVGEVTDVDEERDIIVREDGSLLVDGQCSFYSLLEHVGMEDLYNEHDYNTLSGLILDLLEHIPEAGEKTEWNGLTIEILDMDGARIDKVLVSKI